MDFTSDYRYKRSSYRINVNGNIFYSRGSEDQSVMPLDADAIELRIEDNDNLFFVKNAIEAYLKTPVYITNSFKIKEKGKDYIDLPLAPPKNLNGILPTVNRDIYFTRHDQSNQLIKDVVKPGETLMAYSLLGYKALHGDIVDDNVLWAYFDGPVDGWMTIKQLNKVTHEKEHYESIQIVPEIRDAFTPCSILESVLHINYTAATGEFIELEKLFRMFPLSENVPILRYRTGSNIEPFFKIHKSLTAEFTKDELKELLTVSSASTKDKRYIGFKIRLNQRFNTVNLYADGKIDIYCAWEEKIPGIAAEKSDLLAVLEKVIDLVQEINTLNYHKIGTDSTVMILPPNTTLTGNTIVSNYNTLNLINLPEEDVNFAVLEKKMRDFSSYVTVLNTDDKMILRYKKISNYATSENIKKFIRTSVKDTVLNELQNVFELSLGQAEYFLDKFSDEGSEKVQKPSYPGTLIELSRQHNSTSLRCKFMGANNETIGIIYDFIQKMFSYGLKGKKRPRIVQKTKEKEKETNAAAHGTIKDAGGNDRIILDKTGKVNMTKPKPSLLDYLKIMGLPYIPDKNKSGTGLLFPNYARETCQCHKHPVVIFKEDHYQKLKSELDATQDDSEETNLNRLSFKQGQRDKNGFFYFCPVTWDHQNIKNMDAGRAPYFPKFSEVNPKDKDSSYFRRKPEELKSLYARNDGNGFCCYVNPYKEVETEENKVKTQSYILKSNVDLSPGRFGWLPDNLNEMFNPDVKQKKVYLWMHPGYITDTVDNRSFLACMARINSQTIDTTLEELANFLRQNDRNFMSLKMGSLYTLFTPQDEYSNQQSIQDVLGFERIVDEFFLYVLEHRDKINEDYLWDYFTEKLNCNIFIYEFETETMKCPKGYELKKMYKETRPSVVLNKNGDQYTILSYTTLNNAAPPTANTKHNTETSPIFTLYQTVQKNCQVKTNRLTLSQLQAKLDADPEIMTIMYPQIIDSYNKVRFVRVKKNTTVLWFPLEASGIDTEQGIMPLTGLLQNLPPVFETIEILETLALYYGFDGYLVKHVLLRYGLNMDHANEDTVIGVRLENNLIVYTEPLPVKVFQSVRYFKVMNPDTKQEKKIMNTFMKVREDIWFNDELEYERGYGLDQKDMRQIYVTRLHFEQDAYNRFRTLISELLQEHPADRQKINALVEKGPIEELPARRTAIYEILKQRTKTSVTHISTPSLLNAIGPIDRGYKDITQEDMDYTFNVDLYKPNPGELLFIPAINLITGAKNNMDYYLYRVVEELQRSPFKRDEILNHLLVENTADYYLENTDKAIDKLYETRVSLGEKMLNHYDNLNLKSEQEEDTVSSYLINLKRLPLYWREKLLNAEGVFLQLEVTDLYAELDHILQTSVRAHLDKYILTLPENEKQALRIKYGSIPEDQWHLKMNITDLQLIAKLYGISFLLLKDKFVARIGESEQYIILFQDSLVLSDRKQKIFPEGDLPLFLTGIPPMTEDSLKVEKKKLKLSLKKPFTAAETLSLDEPMTETLSLDEDEPMTETLSLDEPITTVDMPTKKIRFTPKRKNPTNPNEAESLVKKVFRMKKK
jgi:hypothetical protein